MMCGSLAPSQPATEMLQPSSGIGQRLHALQISLSVETIRDVALSSPLWAIIMAALFGGILPDLGNTSLAQSWPWIVLCAVMGVAVFILSRIVKSKARTNGLEGDYWRPLVVAAYFFVSGAWCLVSVIFW